MSMCKNKGKKIDRLSTEFIRSVDAQIGELVVKYKTMHEDGMALSFLATNFAEKGIFNWYAQHDLAAAKQMFYLAARCTAESAVRPRGVTLRSCHDFMFPLLSDNTALIETFSTLSPIGFEETKQNPKVGQIESYLAQSALLKDDKKLEELASVLLASVKEGSKHALFIKHYTDFYIGLAEGDMPKMEEALDFYGKQKSQNPTTEDFLAFHAVVMCKVAWIRGYEVQVDSKRVPMAFMPVAPLAQYDDVYDFLKPGWVAPERPIPDSAEAAPKKHSLMQRIFGGK